MEEILRKQLEQLARMVSLMETDRLAQTHITHDATRSADEEEHMSRRLDEIAHSISNVRVPNQIVSNIPAVPDSATDAARTQATLSEEHLKALKKIQELLARTEQYKSIAHSAKEEPVFKSFKDNFRDIGTFFGNIKSSITNITPKSVGQGMLSAISPRYKDRLDYIKNERNLNPKSNKTDAQLKENYNTRSQLLQRNIKNEEILTKERGSLTEKQFLKGGSKVAKAYTKEQIDIGKGLKATDTRYALEDRLDAEQKAKRGVDNKFRIASESIRNNVAQQARSIDPLRNINLDSLRESNENVTESNRATRSIEPTREDVAESNRATSEYQHSQLINYSEQKVILGDQLKTQKDILEELKGMSDSSTEGTSNGEGISGMFETLIKKISEFMGILGVMGTAAAIPLAVGAVGATAVNYAADKYKDSFGAGGFDLVKKLSDSNAIDYNATVAGFNQSQITDWNAIEKLDPKDLKILIDSGVEFTKEDTEKLHQLFTNKMIKPNPSQAGAIVPTQNISPEIVNPSQAEAVYNKSGENANLSSSVSNSSNNVINAPTVNNNSRITQNVVRLPARNQDNTIQKYVSSRYVNQ